MPTLLTASAVTDEQRRRNDRHNHGLVLATLAVLAVYLYLFTSAADHLGVPEPRQLAQALHIEIPYVFDRDDNVHMRLSVHNAQTIEDRGDSLLVLLLLVAAAFLCAYYLPLRYKQGSLALWSLAAIGILYGSRAGAALLLAHLLVYLVYHPGRSPHLWISAVAGLAGCWAFVAQGDAAGAMWWLPVAALAAAGAYRYAVLPLLQHRRIAAVLRVLVVHAAVLTICVNVLIDIAGGTGILVPLGVLLFFYQWGRLVMYDADYRDGLVPEKLGLDRYLAVFLSPGVLPTWTWAVTIPQGYAYVTNRFLCEDKNRIVLAGLKLLGIALLYLVFWQWGIRQLEAAFGGLGIEVHRSSTRLMVHRFTGGQEVGTLSVLVTTLLDMVNMVLAYAGVVHFKVAVWRICGYNIEPYLNKPWLATNLMNLWTRFSYYYREFLVRIFYYPVFFRLARLHTGVRIVLASFAAAGLGNLISHIVKENLHYEMTAGSVGYVLSTWPYFVLLGAGIGVSMLFMRTFKRRRKAWTFDRWLPLDVLAAYATIQYFSLIHIFARPTDASSLQDLLELFLLGLGIELRTA